jgi:hypothetical protein
MFAITAVPFGAFCNWNIIELRVSVGRRLHYVTRAAITIKTSSRMFYTIVICQGTARVTYVCVNCHHLASGGIWFHVQYRTIRIYHDTTSDQFIYAVHSKQVPLQNFIPNSYPKLNCRFTKELHNNSDHRLHRHCANETGIALWSISRFKHCYSVEEMIHSLIRKKEEWWCRFCVRGLFLRTTCFLQYRDFS